MRKLFIAVLGILAASLLSSSAFAFSGDHARGIEAGNHVVKAGYHHCHHHCGAPAYQVRYRAPCYAPRCYQPCYTCSYCNSYYSPYYGGGCNTGGGLFSRWFF